jgi:hypothetical protein
MQDEASSRCALRCAQWRHLLASAASVVGEDSAAPVQARLTALTGAMAAEGNVTLTQLGIRLPQPQAQPQAQTHAAAAPQAAQPSAQPGGRSGGGGGGGGGGSSGGGNHNNAVINEGARAVADGHVSAAGSADGAAATGRVGGAILSFDMGSREELADVEKRATVVLEATGGGPNQQGGRNDRRTRIRDYATMAGASLCAVTEGGLAGAARTWRNDGSWGTYCRDVSSTLSYPGNTVVLCWEENRYTTLEEGRRRWEATSLAGAYAVKLLDNVTGVVFWHVGAHLAKKNTRDRGTQCLQLEDIAQVFLEEEGEDKADAFLLSADLNMDLPMNGTRRADRYPLLPSFAATIKETTGAIHVLDQIMVHDGSSYLEVRDAAVFKELDSIAQVLDHNPITVRFDHVE